MNVYRIDYNSKIFYVSASSKKAAMIKHFGIAKVAGACIVKVGEE